MKIRASCVSRRFRPRRLTVLCASLGLVAAPAFAQQQTVKLESSLRVSETVTDNAGLQQSGMGKTDWITQISPSVRLMANGGRVNGNLSVGVNSSFYANDSAPQSNHLTLSGSGKVNLVDNHAYVDVLGSIARQSASAFGPRAADTVTGTSNQTEVRTLSISPYLLGRLGSTGTLELRYALMQTESDSSVLSKTQSDTWTLNASDSRASALLGWGLNIRDSRSDVVGQGPISQRSGRLTGFVHLDPQFTMRLIGGTESNNFGGSSARSTSIYGVGADWRPTPRTNVSGTVEDRFFGTGYTLNATHQTGRAAFTGNFTKNVSSTSQTMLGAVSLYDLLMLQYSVKYPDINERSAVVRQLIETNAAGQGGVIVGAQSVLANGFFLDRRFQLGMTVSGVRNTVSLIAFTSERETLTERVALTGSAAAGQNVTTTGGTVTFSHSLSPLTSANAAYSSILSQSADRSLAASRSNIITAGLSTRFSPKMSGSLNIRSNKGSGSSSYSENALIGAVVIQF